MSFFPTVSVIIPTYNGANTIKSAIESVLGQSGCDLDIIVVDDGSTDKTEEVVKSYCDKGLITYLKQENKGSASARNLGIKTANGEYICFLDADDTFQGNSIPERLTAFKKYPFAGLLCTDFKQMTLDNDKHLIYNEQKSRKTFLEDAMKYAKLVDGNVYVFDKKIFYDPLVLRRLIWTGTVMIPKPVFEDVGRFNETLRIAQDIDLWFRIARKYEIVFIDLPTATYFLHGNGVTNNKSSYYIHTIKVLEQYLDPLYKTPNECKTKIKNKISSYYFILGYFYYDKKRYKDAKKYFIKSLINNKKALKCYIYVLITLLPGFMINNMRSARRLLSGLSSAA